MKVLFVASDKNGHFAPFVEEQIEALKQQGCVIAKFGIHKKGVWGYISTLPQLKETIQREQPDVIHAHYGLSALLANLQRTVSVVSTYHGSDINLPKIRLFSQIAIRMSAWNIFVSKRNIALVNPKHRYTLLPCGIDLNDTQLLSKQEAREKLNIPLGHRFVLFASSFSNIVKDPELAKQVVANLLGVELKELSGYTREEVNMLMCAADAFLLTSKTEGSPQVIKEAMACGCPIVSVDVGDVGERIGGLDGCYLVSSRNPLDLAEALRTAMSFVGRTKGRDRIIEMGITNEQVAKTLIDIYNNVI